MRPLHIGRCRIDRIEEWIGPLAPPEVLLPDLPPGLLAEQARRLAPHHLDPATGMLVLSVHSWVLRTPHHVILIDACFGNDKQRTDPASRAFHRLKSPWLERLAAAGVAPKDVDFVMCTHLHVDHVGWNTRLQNGRWVPTFPNATYLVSHREYEYWDPTARGPHPSEEAFEDSVRPIAEAGLMQLLDGAHAIEDGVLIEPAPGHTPGHAILSVDAGGARGIFSGDLMHHVLQVTAPDCNSCFCENAVEARTQRRRLLERCADEDTLVMPAHFGAPHAGRVARAGTGFRFDFLD